ncbi:hypothetical protein ACS5PJ_16695 [Pseudarthrobacter sp. YS3]|jgi:hypothetical protein|uniref:hypothetical protein n=1 Tax=Pseudarthrobacter sp. YS3 TaxID=3453718 RepID=UPI003EEF9517
MLSNPQEPYQPGEPGAGPQQPPAVPIGAPGQYGAPGRYAAPAIDRTAVPDGTPGYVPAPGQRPADGPFGLPGQQPPARGRRKLWTILGIAAGVLLLAVLGVIILLSVLNAATNHARGLADGFTKLVISGDSSKAYDDYLDPALKEQLSKEAFIAGVKSLEMDNSCKAAYNNVKAGTENNTTSADITGVITCDGDKKIDLVYRFEGEALKMVNIKLKPQT